MRIGKLPDRADFVAKVATEHRRAAFKQLYCRNGQSLESIVCGTARNDSIISLQIGTFATKSANTGRRHIGDDPRNRPPTRITEQDTFTLLTCEPNELCSKVHDRMPLMLARDDWAGWLSKPEERAKLLKPFPADHMEMWPVSKAVGSPKNTGPELIEPINTSLHNP